MEGEGRKREEQSPIVPKTRELRADLGQGVKGVKGHAQACMIRCLRIGKKP